MPARHCATPRTPHASTWQEWCPTPSPALTVRQDGLFRVLPRELRGVGGVEAVCNAERRVPLELVVPELERPGVHLASVLRGQTTASGAARGAARELFIGGEARVRAGEGAGVGGAGGMEAVVCPLPPGGCASV